MKHFFKPRFYFMVVLAAVSSPAAQFKMANQTFTLPDGFEIELIAGTNLVQRPISVAFDEQGRLYVTDSSGSNEKVAKQLEEKPHRILRLEDSDGDGKFDRSATFADKFMFPEGAMWLDGSLYVSAPPSIWKLTDTNNDGVVDVREEWHQGKTLTGCANDLHGPYLGPDGWIYWCKGAFAEQTYEVNGKPFTTKAAHIFRARPDHSGMEPVMTGGMDNPVGLAFSPEGERFLAGTFFEPHIPGRRDGVIHAIYGGVYGKPHPEVLDPFKKTGDLMPVMIHLGPAASATVISYRSKVFGDEFQNNLFVGNFNLHDVTRHILEPNGATFKTKDSVFLSSDNPDFHPTCILEDADGSLIVVDTGGWYKICCPTSQLYKPDILGAIYRIRKTGAKKIADPRGLKIDWAKSTPSDLTKFLDDERPFVIQRAIQTLAKQKSRSISALGAMLSDFKNYKGEGFDSSVSTEARRNAIWALTQIDKPSARVIIRNALSIPNDSVQQTAIYSISLWRDKEAFTPSYICSLELATALRKPSLAVRRIAAEALGRSSEQSLIPNLMSQRLSEGFNDRSLEHSVIYALIELNDPKATADFLTNSSAHQRVGLIALDQMDNGNLKAEQVVPFLLSTNTALKEAASWIVSHHPEWGTALAGFFGDALAKKEISVADQDLLVKQLVPLVSDSTVQELLTTTLPTGSKTAQSIALRVMAEANLKAAPTSWATNLVTVLKSDDAKLVSEAVLAAKALTFAGGQPALQETLLHIAENNSIDAEARLNALSAVHGQISVDVALFDFLSANLDSAKPVLLRGAAAAALARGKLNNEQLTTLVGVVKNVGPLEVTKLLSAFERSTNEAIGLKLVAVLKDSKALRSLRVERLKPVFAKYPATVQAEAETLYAMLNTDATKQAARVNKVVFSLKTGDIYRGHAVFNSTKAACASCHTIGYVGGKIGPDLTKIGQVRTERDLAEAIVFPSASFVRSFEPVTISTKDGDTFSGIIKGESTESIRLVSGPAAEQQIARANIAEMQPGSLSVMPEGLDQQLTKQELADLIVFLKSLGSK